MTNNESSIYEHDRAYDIGSQRSGSYVNFRQDPLWRGIGDYEFKSG